MVRAGGRPRDDAGAAVLEYVAMACLAVLVIVLLACVVPGPLADGVRDVICRIVGGRGCARSGGLAHRRPGMPASCSRTQAATSRDHNVKVIAYRRNHDVTELAVRNSDGSISESRTGEGRNGLDVRAGLGGETGKGTPSAELSVGVSYLYDSSYGTRLDFTGDPARGLSPDRQRARYRSLVAERRRAMTTELQMDPARTSDPDFQHRWAQVPRDAAHELHVHTTVTRGGGNDVNAGLDASVALAGLDVSGDSELSTSRSVDDNGTPGRADDVTTIGFADTHDLAGGAGLTITPFPDAAFARSIKGTGRLAGEYSPVTGFQVGYRYGRPATLTMTRQVIRSWGVSGRAGTSGGGTAGFGGRGMTGVVSTRTAAVDVRAHPEVYAALRDYVAKASVLPHVRPGDDPGEGRSPRELRRKAAVRQAATRLRTAATRTARLSEVDYQRTFTGSGPEAGLSRWVELAAAEWTTAHDAWAVRDARYYDRGYGRWMPWPECVRAGGH